MTLLRSLNARSLSTALSWCACKGDDDELQKALEAVEKEQACSKKLESRLQQAGQRNSGSDGVGTAARFHQVAFLVDAATFPQRSESEHGAVMVCLQG